MTTLRVYIMFHYTHMGSYYDSDMTLDYVSSSTELGKLYRSCKKKIEQDREEKCSTDMLLVDGDEFSYREHPECLIFYARKIDVSDCKKLSPEASSFQGKLYVKESDISLHTQFSDLIFDGRVHEFDVVDGHLVEAALISTAWAPPPVESLLRRLAVGEDEGVYIPFPGQTQEELDKILTTIPKLREEYNAKMAEQIKRQVELRKVQEERERLQFRFLSSLNRFSIDDLKKIVNFVDGLKESG